MLNSKDDQRLQQHERHIKEMDSLREKNAKEIELARNSLADLYEKKIEYLSETKDEYDMRL